MAEAMRHNLPRMRMECILFNTIHNHDALFVVDFVEADFDNFGIGGFDGAADEAGLDGQFAMAAVDEHAKADAARTAEIEEAVHCGAYRERRQQATDLDHQRGPEFRSTGQRAAGRR